jgi:hypothetical protein
MILQDTSNNLSDFPFHSVFDHKTSLIQTSTPQSHGWGLNYSSSPFSALRMRQRGMGVESDGKKYAVAVVVCGGEWKM